MKYDKAGMRIARKGRIGRIGWIGPRKLRSSGSIELQSLSSSNSTVANKAELFKEKFNIDTKVLPTTSSVSLY